MSTRPYIVYADKGKPAEVEQFGAVLIKCYVNEPGQEFTIQITDQSFELPTIPGTTFKPRSDDMMPANFSYGTVVVRALTIR